MGIGKLGMVLGICAIIGIGAFVATNQISMIFCTYPDKTFCRFMNSEWSARSGTFKKRVSGNLQFDVNWILDSAQNDEMTYLTKNSDGMHILRADGFIFLKDEGAEMWWKQSQEDAKQFNTTFPFEPEVYFTDLRALIESGDMTIASAGNKPCGGSTCQTYSLSSQSAPNKTMSIYLYSNTAGLAMVESREDDTEIILTSEPYHDMIVSPDRSIKDASVGQNIFLDVQLSQEAGQNTPQFIRDFEEARIKAEQSGVAQSAPEYRAPTPTPTRTP